jgi:cytochrome c biogenesis protein CcdA
MTEAFINSALKDLSILIGSNPWLAPAIALIAGVLTSVTPCSLSSVPLVIAFVGGTGRKNPAAAFRFSLVFALGMAITFTALGTAASALGKLLNFGTSSWWYVLLGALMVAMALQTWGIFTLIPASYAQSRNTRRGYMGAFLTGILGGLFSSPCATPVLIALLALVSRNANPVWGVALLLLYSIGHSVLVIAAGTFMGLTGKLTQNHRYGIFARSVNILLGAGILVAGLYLLYLGF